jgi:hypothetical protein
LSIIRLAAGLPRRRRPVSSTLGLALNIVGTIANGRKSERAGANPSGIRSTAMPTARTTGSRARGRVTGAPRGRSAPSESAAVQSVGWSAAMRQTVPNGTSANGGGKRHCLRLFQRTCACSLSRIGRRTGSTFCAFRLRPAMPNPALNRSANGRSPWPRGASGSSCTSRPRRPAAAARLAPR